MFKLLLFCSIPRTQFQSLNNFITMSFNEYNNYVEIL